jgi:hypothetical protein
MARNPLPLLFLLGGPSSRLADTPLLQLREWKECLGLALGFERSKAVLRHWSYDLNRHIALKNAQDRLIEHIDRRS